MEREHNAQGGASAQTTPEQAAQTAQTVTEQAASTPRETAQAAKPRKAETVVPIPPTEHTPIYRTIVGLYAVVAKLLFFMRIEGRENIPREGCVLMGNHQCLLDPVTLALCTPDREIRFMGKKELFENRVLGWVFRRVHGFPVDRGNMDMAAVRTAMGLLKEGYTLGIFPEGTRSRTGHMLPLLGGASLMALKSGRPVVPVYIDGRYKLFHRIVVRVGQPIDMADLRAGRMNKEACDALTARMQAAFASLSGGKSLPAPQEQA